MGTTYGRMENPDQSHATVSYAELVLRGDHHVLVYWHRVASPSLLQPRLVSGMLTDEPGPLEGPLNRRAKRLLVMHVLLLPSKDGKRSCLPLVRMFRVAWP
eukprot:1485060-Amphidinium_carterae.2